MWNKKKIISFYYVFVECFPLRREKNEMNKFYNRAICSLKFMDKEKCAVLKWNRGTRFRYWTFKQHREVATERGNK